MITFKKISLAVSGAGLAVLSMAMPALAVFDSDVGTALDAGITDIKAQGLEKIADLLPIAFVLLATVAITFAVIKWFRAIVHV